MPSALELAETLIARPSVTPDDAGCQALIASRLAACGFELHHLPHGPSAPPGHPTTQTDPSGGSERSERGGQGLARVDNLWAVHRGPRPGPCLVFAGHTDVVPTGPVERWASDPFVPTHRDGRLYGRGAADMKSGIAAMVVAAEAFARDRATHVGSLALLLTSDEEGPSVDGTVRVVEWLRARGERIDLCVVGEPTSVDRLGDTIKNGRRGSLTGRLRVRGVQGHVAYPQLAVNPIHRLAPALAEWTAEHWDDGNAHFPPTSFQVSNLHAGTGAGNVIPGEAVVDFNFRFSTASTPDALMARVHALLDRHALDYAIDWTLGGEPFLTEPGALSDALAAAIEAECGIRPDLSTTGGTSDGRFIARICPQVVEFGPVNASIHKIDEHVIAADVDRLARIYRHVMDTLLREAHVPHVPTAAGSS